MRKFKIFFMLLCVCVLIFGSVISVSAYSSKAGVTKNGWTDENGVFHAWKKESTTTFVSNLLDLDFNFVIIKSSDNCYLIYYSEVPFFARQSASGTHNYQMLPSDGYFVRYINLELTDGVVTSESYDNGGYNYALNTITNVKDVFINDILVYSNNDIYTDDTCTTIFFHPAEPPILATAVAPVNLAAVMQEVMMMLPIGLGCLVSFIALRKALALLRQILLQA